MPHATTDWNVAWASQTATTAKASPQLGRRGSATARSQPHSTRRDTLPVTSWNWWKQHARRKNTEAESKEAPLAKTLPAQRDDCRADHAPRCATELQHRHDCSGLTDAKAAVRALPRCGTVQDPPRAAVPPARGGIGPSLAAVHGRSSVIGPSTEKKPRS